MIKKPYEQNEIEAFNELDNTVIFTVCKLILQNKIQNAVDDHHDK